MKTIRCGSLFFLVLMLSSVYSQQQDWKSLKINGKVKSIEIINYTAGDKFGEITKMGILDGEQYQFNENGLVIQKKRYGKAGLPIEQLTFKFDTLNNLLEQNIFDKKGILQRKIIREYNQFNNKTYETVYGPDGILMSRSVFQYKEGVIPQKIVTFDRQGTQINLQEYIYNKKTTSRSITTTNPKSKIIEKAEKYNSDENLTDLLFFDVEGNLKSNFKYSYNKDNQLIESEYFLQNKLMVKRVLQYNNLGFLVEIKVNYPEKEKTDVITYSYDFDEKSNWIKSVEYLNSIPVKLSERKILYF